MTNRSKAKGTAAETAVTRYAREHGFPLADRRPLKGNADEGDILLAPGLIVEVKAGKAAQSASLNQIYKWLAETHREQLNAHADHSLLVIQRRGYGLTRPAEWECWQYAWVSDINCPITTDLGNGLLICRKRGWGNPL